MSGDDGSMDTVDDAVVEEQWRFEDCITPQMFSCECCVLDCMCRLMHYSLRAVLEYSLTGPSYEWCGLDYCLRAALGLHCVS